MRSDAVRGRLEALILAVLEQGPLHGYGVIEALRARSAGALALPTGTVYPALRQLERAGYVRSQWSTVAGRDRRTYRLTSAGRRRLREQRAEWRDFASVIDGLLAPGQAPA